MFPVSSQTRLGNMILHLWLEIRKLEIGKPLTFRSLKSALISFGLGANLTSSSGPVSGPIAQATGWPIYHVLTELGLGLKLLGPTPSLGQPKRVAPISVMGRPLWPNLQSRNSSKNCTDFRITAPFSQNEIARFFQRSVISKITYLIN